MKNHEIFKYLIHRRNEPNQNILDCPTRARFKSNLGHFSQSAFNLDIRPKDEQKPEIKQHVHRWNEFRH